MENLRNLLSYLKISEIFRQKKENCVSIEIKKYSKHNRVTAAQIEQKIDEIRYFETRCAVRRKKIKC